MIHVHNNFLSILPQETIYAVNEKEIFGKNEFPHMEHIKLRIGLIGNLIEASNSILKFEHLERLWDILITKNRIAFDH